MVIVVIIAGVGFFVYHSENSANEMLNSTPTTGTSTSKASSSSTNKLVITEWPSISFTYSAPIHSLSYMYNKDTDSIVFSSDLESQLPATCDSDKGAWGVSRYQSGHITNSDGDTIPDSSVAGNKFLHQFGSYYYKFDYPEEGCSQAAAVNTAYEAVFGIT